MPKQIQYKPKSKTTNKKSHSQTKSSPIKKMLAPIFCISLLAFIIIGTIVSNIPIVKTEEVTETIYYSTSTIYDDNMREGLSELKQEGKNGKKTVTYSVTYRQDKEIDRKKETEVIIEPVINEIIVKGTKKYYLCSNGVEYDNINDKNECEKRISWEQQKQTALQGCYADSNKFDCWYDEYPGTTLHWNYQVYNSPSPNTNSRRSGAICKDGWHSNATGRGACSHHGGVLYWI